MSDPLWSLVAVELTDQPKQANFESFELRQEPQPFQVYGKQHIDEHASRQMDWAMRLPVSIRGALMPDAHAGFGLPIGGVLATANQVIPFAVGVDIGCRMALTIFEDPASFFKSHNHEAEKAIRNFTHFGMEGNPGFPAEHDVLDHPSFRTTELLRRLQGKAAKQLGSSGGGNHFVEFGTIEMHEANVLGLPSGRAYVALLSHSGSRGLGAGVARHYTDIAMDKCRLPDMIKHMAWLDMHTEEGQEYWISMQLAGAYASACHEVIHANLSRELGLTPLIQVSNHHNFAWKEKFSDGNEYVVHRKGATPAGKGVMGIIPGSMCAPAYLVSGKGNESTLLSASHGAGRAMSRQRAKERITVSGLRKTLSSSGVQLIGGNVEEAPEAYKDIASVMKSQRALVNIEGVFYPKIVRMNKD
ncbi:RtcB family protein [Rurimicrobium arvi]